MVSPLELSEIYPYWTAVLLGEVSFFLVEKRSGGVTLSCAAKGGTKRVYAGCYDVHTFQMSASVMSEASDLKLPCFLHSGETCIFGTEMVPWVATSVSRSRNSKLYGKHRLSLSALSVIVWGITMAFRFFLPVLLSDIQYTALQMPFCLQLDS